MRCFSHFFQTMNSNAVTNAPRSNGDISLHSCNICEKVFKSLSHIRYHCLTHIDGKSFKCPECDFRSNSKGMYKLLHNLLQFDASQIEGVAILNSSVTDFCLANQNLHFYIVVITEWMVPHLLAKVLRSTRLGMLISLGWHPIRYLIGCQNSGQNVVSMFYVLGNVWRIFCRRGLIFYYKTVTGNIYSHMRKHTGQYYRCRTCEFKTVNKSHLLEHEGTHSGTVHSCSLCRKHYSTIKSLSNHVRIYHSNTEEGKVYYQKFVNIKEGKLKYL